MKNEQCCFIYYINEHYFDVWVSYLLKGGSAEKTVGNAGLLVFHAGFENLIHHGIKISNTRCRLESAALPWTETKGQDNLFELVTHHCIYASIIYYNNQSNPFIGRFSRLKIKYCGQQKLGTSSLKIWSVCGKVASQYILLIMFQNCFTT